MVLLHIYPSFFKNRGYNSFRFDFRAHGQSAGKDIDMTLNSLKEDLCSTISFIQKRGFEEIYILGSSFGASIVSLLDYTSFPGVKKLIIYSGSLDFDKGNPKGSLGTENYKTAIENGYVTISSKTTGCQMQLSKKFMLETRHFHPGDKIKHIDLPILFLHGTDDETTPCKVNKNIADECKHSYFLDIPGGAHGLHRRQDIILSSECINRFLKIKDTKEIDENEEDLTK